MLATALGLLNVSGAVRDDWWRMVTGQQLPLDAAVRISDTVDGSAFMPLWSGTEIFAFLGLLALSAGLGRAGVVGWWLGWPACASSSAPAPPRDPPAPLGAWFSCAAVLGE
ncbi:hypothetical protein [Nonomuraea sp. 10N515B]|uniref:hypothetical protein n=1 Tax=Nonomuraea sp. 10N515B TaxID=3457422 RepID=UPI003FCC3FF8